MKKFSWIAICLLMMGTTLWAADAEKKEEKVGDKKEAEAKAPAATTKPADASSPKPKSKSDGKMGFKFEFSVPGYYFESESSGLDTNGGASGIRLVGELAHPQFFGRLELNVGLGAGEVEVSGGDADIDYDEEILDITGGYRVKINDKLTLIPIGGFGFLFQNLDIDGTSNNIESFFFYISMGARVEYQLNEKLFIGFELTLRVALLGESEVGSNDDDVDPSVGMRLTVPIRYQITDKISFTFTIFFRHFAIEYDDTFADVDFNETGAWIGVVVNF